jgi:hypothetical protein
MVATCDRCGAGIKGDCRDKPRLYEIGIWQWYAVPALGIGREESSAQIDLCPACALAVCELIWGQDEAPKVLKRWIDLAAA